MPCLRANSQLRVARGPGPTAEMQYSPTTLSTPPRLIFMLHSLTLMNAASAGNPLMICSARPSGQPQSQIMSCAFVPDCPMPSWISTFACAYVCAACPAQRGQLLPLPCDQQCVRFSEPLILKIPARSGTALQMYAIESTTYFFTSGVLMHKHACWPDAVPFNSGCVLKKSSGIVRGSLRYKYTPIFCRAARATNARKFV